ncbi:MAG: hypothetical protein Q9170_002149 [Blastenia crenularia]
MQQPSGSFNFGQQAGAFSNPAGSASSFPIFGDQNASSGQQSNSSSSAGFNFAAPQINNPFASFNQSPNTQTPSSGFSGSIFNLPPSTPAPPQASPKLSASEMKTPSQWRKDIPEANKEKDPQSFFVPHAPFKWGQPDPPQQAQSQPAPTESQGSQPSTGIFGQNDSAKPATSNIFAHLQTPTSSSSNIFGQQQSSQQPQTSNIFGSKTASPFQSQSSQPSSNPFGQSFALQNQYSNSFFNKPATSPTEEGDTMSTTPDTSPQAINDRARYGPFASINASSRDAHTNGTASENLGSGAFGASTQAPSNQLINGDANNQSAAAIDAQATGNTNPDISLGSPSKRSGTSSIKNRSIAQPKSHIEDKTPTKNPFAGLQFPAPTSTPPASPFPFSFAPNQKPSLASPQTNGVASSLFAKPAPQSTLAAGSRPKRQPGMPPEAPAHFTEEQKRQLITGWRLKSLDVGLQSYLRHSSYSKEEIESVTEFYEMRKQAILEANGGPLPELKKKRAVSGEQLQSGLLSKKARHELTTESSSRPTALFPAGNGSPSKRKANEDLHENNDNTASNGLKRWKPDDQITYPSLSSASSGSKTAKIFGSLVGNKDQDNPSDDGDAAANGHSSMDIAPKNPAPSFNLGSPQSDLFFKAPTSSTSMFAAPSFPNNNKQTPSFGFGKDAASTPLESKSENPKTSSQNPSTQATTTFKGFFPSQSNINISAAPTGDNFMPAPQGPFDTQSSNTPSMFSNLNNQASKRRSPKRTAEDVFDEDDGKTPSHQGIIEQPSKKQKAEEDHTGLPENDTKVNDMFKPQTTKERSGFGESIFARSSTQPVNSFNLFGHLKESTPELDDPGDGDESKAAKDNKATRQTTAASMENPTPKPSTSNPARSSVFNPFASSTFDAPPKSSSAEEKPASRSLFDRIEIDGQVQPIKTSKPVDFGQSILKTPAGTKPGGFFGQSTQTTSKNPVAAPSSTTGNGIFGSKSTSATPDMASATPAPSMFGKPSTSNNAPVAKMTSSQASEDSPSGDNTWKPSTPIKFGDSSSVPSVNLTSPSPSKSPFTGLFGATKANVTSEASGSSIFKPVDSNAAKPATLTFGISAPPKDSSDSLAPPSETQSENTSRASSPGAASGGNGNEPSDAVHDEETHLELDVTEAGKAEADEDVVFNEAGKVFKYEAQKWVLQGNEQFRVLKHHDTNKTRMVMKLKVNGRVILNAGLQKSLSYVFVAPKKVRIPIPINGKVETWMVSFGETDAAKKLVNVLEDNKAY